MVDKASVDEISYIIEGALSHEHSIGIEKTIGKLLQNRDLIGGSSDKEKLQLAIKTITEERLLKLVDKNELPLLTIKYRTDFFHQYNDIKVELLQKYGKELSLSEKAIEQIKAYEEHLKALCEVTKDMPQLMYE